MKVIGTELSQLSSHYLKKLLHLTSFTFYHLHIPFSTKPGQNIYVQQNLNEFDHGSNWIRTTGVIWS